MTPNGDVQYKLNLSTKVSLKDKTHKEDNGHHTRIAECKTLRKGDEKHLRPYGESMKTVKRAKGTGAIPKEDNIVKTPAKEHKTSHGYGDITLDASIGDYSTPVGDKISMHGSWNKGI